MNKLTYGPVSSGIGNVIQFNFKRLRNRLFPVFLVIILNAFIPQSFAENITGKYPANEGDLIYFSATTDTIESIAKRFTGSLNSISEIQSYNNLGSSEDIKAGQKIKIPYHLVLEKYRLPVSEPDSAIDDSKESETSNEHKAAVEAMEPDVDPEKGKPETFDGKGLVEHVRKYQELLRREKDGVEVNDQVIESLKMIIDDIDSLENAELVKNIDSLINETIKTIISRKNMFSKALFLRLN